MMRIRSRFRRLPILVGPAQIPKLITYKKHLKTHRPKSALLSYLVQPLVDDLEGQTQLHFSNPGIVIAWAKVLNELGYTVDCINWDDRRPLAKQYDLVVAHGGKNTATLLRSRKPDSKLLYWSSGAYWKFHNQMANERASGFYKRHGIKLQPDRQIGDPEEEITRAADAVICLGTPEIRKTYASFPNVYTVEVASYPDNHFRKSKKDFSEARQNFLYFAGGGNLHKGLDLLLDAFSELSEQHLYICSSLSEPFAKFYKDALERPNTSFEGIVELGTPQFYSLVNRCAYAITLSASEGGPGSMADCMMQGLVPVVSPQSFVWTGGGKYGKIVSAQDPEKIRAEIVALSKISPAAIKKMSGGVYEHAIREQTPEQFEQNLQKALQSVLEVKNG